jgi:hypothetical protein
MKKEPANHNSIDIETNILGLTILAVVDGEKGGVGKSFFARAISDFLITLFGRFRGLDFDESNENLARFYHDTNMVDTIEWQKPAECERAYHLILDTDPRTPIVIDFPAQIRKTAATEWNRFLSNEENGRNVLVFWVMYPSYDSINSLRHRMSVVDPAKMVVMINLRDSNIDLSLWSDSATRREFLERGGTEGYVPRLPESLALRLENEDLSFAAARASDLRPYHKRDLQVFTQEFRAEILSVLKKIHG